MTYSARHISVSIQRPVALVYAFVSAPENLPRWAAGLSGSIEKVGDAWIAESPMGKVRVRFVEGNSHGVLDHEVTLPDGTRVYNPMRVMPNHLGSELVFTLYRLPNMSDDAYSANMQAIERDLRTVKSLLESQE